MVRSRSAAAAVLAAAAALVAAGCTTSSEPSAGGGSGPFRYAVTSDANTFDPALGTAATDYSLARMQFGTLVYRDADQSVVPGLAEKWTAAPDSATFTLRGGLTCSDGKPLTAGDVAASLRRWADPKTGAAGTGLAFGPGAKVTVASDDAARTVTVKLSRPWSDLVPAMAMTNAGIVCPPGLKDPKALGQEPVPGAGTGPYTLSDAQRGRQYTFKLRDGYNAFPAYRKAKVPAGDRPATVRLSVVSNESTAANQLSTGELDYAAFTGPDAARFAGGGYHLHVQPLLRMFVVFNERKGHPGADPKFRKAVAQALDPAAFNKVYGGKGEVMKSWSDSTSQCANTDGSIVTKTDSSAAKKALNGVSLKLNGTNSVAGGSGNTYVQEALRALGAKVELRNVDNATWASDVLANKGDWDVTVMAHLNFSGTLTAGAILLTGPNPPEGRNFGGIGNAGFDAGFAKAMATTDQAGKCAAWGAAQKALLERDDVVPLSTVPVAFVLGKSADAVVSGGAVDPTSFRVQG
ncbi:ABC transporter substrate-binding protein [Actinomadura opuntiae]|uniref:ABC transporter substrate-binding protein n=1 Tax=Actinomadura sp. OS1-43 TaxID=604315 RepID=UPI00255AC5BC|nr:ABC transporter substrate-binding protein [Actinomadura sp. OS1-43]MDL4819541.1 ABC transporter substrate-binding protein [Actinomadura sp. OS1-43]